MLLYNQVKGNKIKTNKEGENNMKNVMVAIQETETRCRDYVVIDCDIATGKAYAYNPEVGCKVITPYKDRNAFQTKYINENPYPWMVNFDTSKIEIPENWMES